MAGGALGPGESFVLCDTSDYDQARRRPAATAPCCPPPAIFRDLLCYLVVWCSGDRACRPGAAKLHAAPQSPPAPPGGPRASGITPRRGAGAGGVRGHGRRGAPRGPLAAQPSRLTSPPRVRARHATPVYGEGTGGAVAAQADPNPGSDWETSLLPRNVIGCYNGFHAAHEAGCARIVYASSVNAVTGYGDQAAPPHAAARPPHP